MLPSACFLCAECGLTLPSNSVVSAALQLAPATGPTHANRPLLTLRAMHSELCAAPLLPCRLRISVADFDILERLGDGSFSTVVLARYKGDGQQYAVKIVNKTLILRNKVLCCEQRPVNAACTG